MFQKHFTVEEARGLLPQLRQIFADAHRRRDAWLRSSQQADKLLEQAGGDIGGATVTGMLMDFTQLNAQMQRIQKLGVIVKDFERGLLDFPHLRNGREVFLCWEIEEDDIEFWHDLDTGYAGRERL